MRSPGSCLMCQGSRCQSGPGEVSHGLRALGFRAQSLGVSGLGV